MEQDEKTELALQMAKKVINLSVGILVFCVLWILQDGLFPTIFDAAPELTELDSTAVDSLNEEQYVPVIINSNCILNPLL